MDAMGSWKDEIERTGPFPYGRPLPDDFIPPSPEEILAMSREDRVRTVNWLDDYDFKYGTHHLQEYEQVKHRCPHVDEDGHQCRDRKHVDLSACLKHVSLDELDPKGASRRRRGAAKLRMEELLDEAVTQLETIIKAPAELVAPSVRLQALQMLFDRSGLPKEQNVAVDARVEVFDAGSAADVVKARMASLRESLLTEELRGIQAASDAQDRIAIDGAAADGSVVEGTVLD